MERCALNNIEICVRTQASDASLEGYCGCVRGEQHVQNDTLGL